jgi:predicted nucleic acid-binding protein
LHPKVHTFRHSEPATVQHFNDQIKEGQERKERIKGWKKYAAQDIQESSELIETANLLNQKGLQKIDSLHIACAIFAKCEYFLTTDDKILQREKVIDDININDPIGFIKEVLS